MLSSKLYYIDSENRLNGTTNKFSYSMQVPDGKFDSVVCLAASIPMSFYTIEDGFNTFVLTELDVQTTITVPIGNYTVMNFPLVIKALLNGASPHLWTYNITFPSSVTSGTRGRFIYTVSGNTGQPSFFFTNEMHEQFGFLKSTVNTFVDNILESTCVVSFIPDTRLFIHSDICINYDDGDSVLQEIYSNNVVPMSMISYQLSTDPVAYSKKLRIDNSNVYNFWLTNKNNDIIDLNGLDILITVLLFKKDDILKKYIQYLLLKSE